MKLLPFNVTFKRLPLPALFGEIEASVGAGLETVKPFVSVVAPPPGAEFVKDTFLAPSEAEASIVIVAIN